MSSSQPGLFYASQVQQSFDHLCVPAVIVILESHLDCSDFQGLF